MEYEEVRRPLKIFGWAIIMVGFFCWTLHTARYWTDFSFAIGTLLLWIDVRKKRKLPESNDIGDIYRRKIWKQEQPLLMITAVSMTILAVTQFPFMYNYYSVRNIIRNLVFLALMVCLVWLVILLIRRDFGKASRATRRERKAFRQIHDGAKMKHENRKKEKEQKRKSKNSRKK